MHRFVGEFRFPKYELIIVFSGSGQIKIPFRGDERLELAS